MSAPALPVSLERALGAALDTYDTDKSRGLAPAVVFLESLQDLPLPSLATLSPAQSERLEAAYLAGAKCIDDAGLLLAVPRDALLVLTAPETERGGPVSRAFIDQLARALLDHRAGRTDAATMGQTLMSIFSGPANLAYQGRAAMQDAEEAELWRFMMASISEDSAEFRIMESLSGSFELDTENADQARHTFEAHVRAGLAQLKDENAALEHEHEQAGR